MHRLPCLLAVVVLVSACPRSTLLGAPCDQGGEQLCEGTQLLRCDGRQYALLALCHGDCVIEARDAGELDTAARTHEQGALAANETWLCEESPHLIRGIVSVPRDLTLNIAAGSIVRLEPASHVDVDERGRIVIDGTDGAPVLFTSNNQQQGGFATAATGGLNVFAGTSEPSVIRHLIVERGQNGLGVFGLSSTATPPVIERSTFRDNTLFGIRISCDAVDSPVPDFGAAGNLFFANGNGDVSTCAAQ